MTASRQLTGRRGEDLVAAELARLGWRVIDRNVRLEGIRGELDIVADDGRDIVFVEVKAQTEGSPVGPRSPFEMVGPRKRAQLRALAGTWCEQHGTTVPRNRGIRIDVVAVVFGADGTESTLDRVEAAC